MKKKQKNNRFFMVMKSEIQKDLKAIIKKENSKNATKTSIVEYTSKICNEICESKYDFLIPRRKEKEGVSTAVYKDSSSKAKEYLKDQTTNVTEMIERVVSFRAGKRIVEMEIEVESMELFEKMLEENGVKGVFRIKSTDL